MVFGLALLVIYSYGSVGLINGVKGGERKEPNRDGVGDGDQVETSTRRWIVKRETWEESEL